MGHGFSLSIAGTFLAFLIISKNLMNTGSKTGVHWRGQTAIHAWRPL